MAVDVNRRAWWVSTVLLIASGLASGVSPANTGSAAQQPATAPYLYVLGTAQDGGYPQAGCFKPHCMPGWEHPELRHPTASLGLIVPATSNKYLFDATPNFPEQLHRLDVEAPETRYRFGGVFLTHAHIGHYVGLMYFGREVMGSKDVPVYAMPRMRVFLTDNGPWSQLVALHNIALRALEDGQATSLPGEITVTPLRVPHRDEFSETVGFIIKGPHKSALFIPDIDRWETWSRSLRDLLKTVDYALVDATFYSMGELPGRDMREIPHPLVTHTMALLADLPASERGKVYFIHMNHSNPLLRADSPETQTVEQAGFHVAREGMRLGL